MKTITINDLISDYKNVPAEIRADLEGKFRKALTDFRCPEHGEPVSFEMSFANKFTISINGDCCSNAGQLARNKLMKIS
jgi:hypothetical protein